MICRISSLKKEKGFSLVEMLISMVIFSIVMGIIYTYLLQTKQDVTEVQVELNTADNAQTAINALRKDLYRIGTGRDARQDQPQLLRAGMYDLIFVADLDQEVRNKDNRYGSPNPALTFPPFSEHSDYYPLLFLYDPTIPDIQKSHGYSPSAQYGNQNLGAEIVRYSLDIDRDGRVSFRDLEDNMSLDPGRRNTTNPNDFWLNKEWWGAVQRPGRFENEYSGNHPVAFNLRGMFYNAEGGVMSSEINRFKYPNGEYPAPLFTYWGHFYNTITANDEPEDENWPGEPIELWGDWGGRRPLLNQPSNPDPSTGARDGVLSQVEINYMYSNPLYSEVNLNYLTASSGRAGEREGQDLNGNGIEGEQRLDDFIRRIGVTIVTEADDPNPRRPNLQRSDLSNPSNPVYYYYQDYELSVQINPRNLAYAGNPVIDTDQMTPTPQPPTPTPAPPTNTPDPSISPTPTNTSPPTPTPATTPGLYDPNDAEILFGTNINLFLSMNINRYATNASEICASALRLDIFGGIGAIIDMEPANFCDTVGSFDQWNDLVIATDATNGITNLIHFKHEKNTGIDGLRLLNRATIGSDPLDRISCIEVGNLGYFGLADIAYDEVVVAYRRPGIPNQVFLEVFFLNFQCGDLVSAGASLPIEPFVTDSIIRDMVISDFDGDGLGELVILWDSLVSTGLSQVRYYPDLNNTATGWNDYHEWFIDWGEEVQCAKVLAASSALNYPPPLEKDLIVVADNGDFRIIPNLLTGIQGNMPFPLVTSDFHAPSVINFPLEDVTGAIVYNELDHDLAFVPHLAILGRSSSDEYYQLVQYDITDPLNIIEKVNCTGPIVPMPPGTPAPTPVFPIVQPLDLVYAPTIDNAGTFYNRNLISPTMVDVSDNQFITLMNPCFFADTANPPANCQFELTGVIGQLTCAASVNNAYSHLISYMPTPTPVVTPTP